MRSKYWNLLFTGVISFLIMSCGEDEEPFICETNTVFQFAGASDKWCGTTELRGYSYNEIEDREGATIFVRYPAGNVTLLLNKTGQFVVGSPMKNGGELGLSGDIGSINAASLTFTKIDREQGVVSFQFDLDYHAATNLTHWDVIGTVTDLPLEVQ